MIEDTVKNQEGEMSPRRYVIRQSIDDELKLALKERRLADLMAYRNIKAELTSKEKETGKPADDSVIIALFKSMVKSRNKAVETFVAAGREDLADENRREIAILSKHLPKQMEANEVKYTLEAIAKEHSMYSKADFGRIMKIYSEQHPEEDKGLAAQILKNILV